MPEYLRSLIIIFFLAIFIFYFLRSTAKFFSSHEDFKRRRNLWLGLTFVIFITHNIWLYVIIAGLILLLTDDSEQNKTALFFILLFAAPPYSSYIPAFNIINYFFSIDSIRLLELVILLPSFLKLSQKKEKQRFWQTPSDKILGGYAIWSIVVFFLASTFTDTLRQIFYVFIDIFLPYYVISRSLKNIEDFREAIFSFVVAALILSVIGIFEYFRSWLLYSSLKTAMGFFDSVGSYLLRGGSLRAMASTEQPIILGYVMVIALGFFFTIQKFIISRLAQYFWLLMILAGLFVSQSRGPWFGAILLVLVFIATGPKAGKGLVMTVILGSLVVGLMSTTPAGVNLLNSLPFVGTIEQGNVAYRQLLIENCIKLLKNNMIFGVPNALASPELRAMKQGQGIIDIVNSYVAVALNTGLVGLVMFVSFFATIGIGLLKAMRSITNKENELHLLGRMLFSTLIAILVMIGTVSSISFIPVIYWSVTGLAIAYIELVKRSVSISTLPMPGPTKLMDQMDRAAIAIQGSAIAS